VTILAELTTPSTRSEPTVGPYRRPALPEPSNARTLAADDPDGRGELLTRPARPFLWPLLALFLVWELVVGLLAFPSLSSLVGLLVTGFLAWATVRIYGERWRARYLGDGRLHLHRPLGMPRERDIDLRHASVEWVDQGFLGLRALLHPDDGADPVLLYLPRGLFGSGARAVDVLSMARDTGRWNDATDTRGEWMDGTERFVRRHLWWIVLLLVAF